jgi:agmatine/peptidylarginine deiminase
MSTHKEYNEDYPETPEDKREHYHMLMMELSDVLEGGDVGLDFEGNGRMIGVISCISAIVRNELHSIDTVNQLQAILKEIQEEEE